jgi:hypothetical protein
VVTVIGWRELWDSGFGSSNNNKQFGRDVLSEKSSSSLGLLQLIQILDGNRTPPNNSTGGVLNIKTEIIIQGKKIS